jgi:hypothetical protein
VARATASFASLPATAEEAAEQSALRCRADAVQARRASRAAMYAGLVVILRCRMIEMWGRRDEMSHFARRVEGQRGRKVARWRHRLGGVTRVAKQEGRGGERSCKKLYLLNLFHLGWSRLIWAGADLHQLSRPVLALFRS